jgi:DNA mismatch endonuclease (patch repair protein)
MQRSRRLAQRTALHSGRMVDWLTRKQRSRNMSAIRQKDTKPELAVRRLLHGLGYRYRLHHPRLPGKPDLVFPARRKIVLIHGCFWHGHVCGIAKLPKSRLGYWLPKIAGNRMRDERNIAQLRKLGWRTLVIWECEVRKPAGLRGRLVRFLGKRPVTAET